MAYQIIVAAAMREELTALISEITPDELDNVLAGIDANPLKHHSVTKDRLVITYSLLGIGRTAAAIGLTSAIAEVRMTYGRPVAKIYVGGSCAAYLMGTDKAPIGQVLHPKISFYGDVDVTAFNYVAGQMAQQPKYFDLNQWGEGAQEQCVSITFDSFIADADRLVNTIGSHIKNVPYLEEGTVYTFAVDMELAAIGQTAHHHGLSEKLYVAKAISDFAGVTVESDSAATDFEANLKIASESSAKDIAAHIQKTY